MDANEEPRLLGSPDAKVGMSIALGGLLVTQRPDVLRGCVFRVFEAAI